LHDASTGRTPMTEVFGINRSLVMSSSSVSK
jgi:hypothetical protein